MKINLFLFLFFSLIKIYSFAQTVREKAPTYFGIQFKPIFPEDFLSKSVVSMTDDTLTGTFTQLNGYSFGGVVRIGLTPLISFETGINQTKRNYNVNFSHKDSLLDINTKLSINTYDIPLNLLIYVQLSKKIFTNVSLGASIVNFPSNVGAKEVQDNHSFIVEARRNRFFSLDLNANLGFEFRTNKFGYYYIGASAKLPVNPIYKVATGYVYGNTVRNIANNEINGAYLSVDLRYFFPNSSKKTKEAIKGPITQ